MIIICLRRGHTCIHLKVGWCGRGDRDSGIMPSLNQLNIDFCSLQWAAIVDKKSATTTLTSTCFQGVVLQ